jgi:hypothetical protein
MEEVVRNEVSLVSGAVLHCIKAGSFLSTSTPSLSTIIFIILKFFY